MKKRTKIIATIGPASDSIEQITSLIRAGVNLFRLNFSHGTYQYHSEVLGRIKKASRDTGLIIGVMQDISGPKIRVGMLKEDFILKSGDHIEFIKDDIVGHKVSDGRYRLSINEPNILSQLKVGEYIYMYDGIIRSRVEESSDNGVVVRVENDGMLSSKKGVNFPNTKLGIDVLTQKDREDMVWGIEHGVDYMAISFVQTAKDIENARDILDSHNSRVKLIAKIEKFDAVENIDEILEASDGIMVARGDLGIEMPYFDIPQIQKMLISKANSQSKPVITATQMLLSMTQNERATRAEISDVANAVLDGTDAVMLSEESAIGKHPTLAVKTMVNTIQGAEKNYPFYKFSKFDNKDRDDQIDESAVRLSQGLETDGILTFTAWGDSARKIARYRPTNPIYAIISDETTARSLTLIWGVVPAFYIKKGGIKKMISRVLKQGVDRGVLDMKKNYILTAGDPVGVHGTTNLIRIITKAEMKFFLKSYTKSKS
ncbi:Pyruvate kinase [hydrothermal vent metagenome]|uniref:pyruvate kinase n=1 Tax=hydrothermal vent metagenome TaxID=652676 RepID=A0A1W1CEM6_9ZZZZ